MSSLHKSRYRLGQRIFTTACDNSCCFPMFSNQFSLAWDKKNSDPLQNAMLVPAWKESLSLSSIVITFTFIKLHYGNHWSAAKIDPKNCMKRKHSPLTKLPPLRYFVAPLCQVIFPSEYTSHFNVPLVIYLALKDQDTSFQQAKLN